MSREKNSMRNTIVAAACYLASSLLGFVTRTFFIQFLGKDYLGVNGLFTNILSLLSFAELGIGTAILFSLYKPLADGDERRVSALINLYRKAYTVIAAFIAVAGLCLVPFLDHLIKGGEGVEHLRVLYVLVLADSVASYLLVYKRSIVIASQNAHINSAYGTAINFLKNGLQILLLYFMHRFASNPAYSYIVYLLVQIGTTLLLNFWISKKADQLFPYMRQYKKERVDKPTIRSIAKNVVAMMCSKIGGVIVTGTDNLLISAFVSLGDVAIYTNYVMIYTMINGMILQVFSAVSASVGNLNAEGNAEHSYRVFKRILFMNFIIMCCCATLLFSLFNPFITEWVGTDYLFPMSIVSIIVLNFFISGMRQTAIIYIDTNGLFWQIKYKALVEAAINIVASLALLVWFDMGVYGVLLGTFISTITTNVWWEPYVVYKHKFHQPLRGYFFRLLGYTAVTFGICALVQIVCSFVAVAGWAGVFLRGVITVALLASVLLLIFGRTENFRYFKKLFADYKIKLQ